MVAKTGSPRIGCGKAGEGLPPLPGRRYVTLVDRLASSRYVTIMVLTNAQRQALYRRRIKAQAAQAAMTPARFDLLQDLRRRQIESRAQIERMEAGVFRIHETTVEGQRDITAQAIELERSKIADVDRVLALYDPDGLTVLDDG